MRYIFKFPDIGEGITEGKILEWFVEIGQEIKSGDPVVKMETDKVVDDIPSPRDGKIIARFGEVDEVIKVGAPLITIEVKGVESFAAPDEDQSLKQPVVAKPQLKQAARIQEPGFGVVGQLEEANDDEIVMPSREGQPLNVSLASSDTKKTIASPVARSLAKKMGIDLNHVKGSGPGGRIIREDVQYFAEHQSNPAQETPAKTPVNVVVTPFKQEVAMPRPVVASPELPVLSDLENSDFVPLSQIRKAIARQMTVSKQTIPHMTVFEEVEISRLVEFREAHKVEFNEMGVRLTYLPFIIKALVAGLKKYRKLNSQFDLDNSRLILKSEYNIGIAMDALDGLVVPVIRHADRLSIFELAKSINDLTNRAQQRQLALAELKGGTFSITNFGSLAGIHAAPIINHPEVGILGVGRIRKMPVVKDDQIVIGHMLPLSLAVDHRALDGGEVTRFLVEVMGLLANPGKLLLF